MTKVGNIAEVRGGKRLPKGVAFADTVTPFPYLRIVDFHDGSIRNNELKYLTPETQNTINRYTISKNDIYISIAGTIGLVGTIPDELDGANLTENAAKLVIRDAVVDKDFLVHYLASERGRVQIEALTTKTTQPKLALARIQQIVIPQPPIEEQRAIALVLQAIKAAKHARVKELALEQERKEALMRHFFAQDEGCRLESLGSLCNVRYGLGQPPRLDDAGIPIIRATDIKSGQIKSETVLRVARDAVPSHRNAFLNRGEIIVVRSGAYTGDIAMYDGRWPEAVAGYDLVVTVVSAEIKPEYLTYYLLGESAQRYFRSQRDRAAQPHLNAQQLKNTSVLFPPLKVQADIAAALRFCNEKLNALATEVRFFEELFNATLDELIVGNITVSPLTESTFAV
jgi:type I restriction enzyme S subunit